MNKTEKSAVSLVKNIEKVLKNNKNNIVVFSSFPYLKSVKENTKKIKVGAQNCSAEAEGAFTGEVSAKQIKEFCSYVLIGHSERRRYQKETDKEIASKVVNAISAGLKVVLCVGEDINERKSGKTFNVIKNQLLNDLSLVSRGKMKNIIVAYEPIWSLSTTKNRTDCSQESAKDAVLLINDIINKKFHAKVKVLYGGNVNPEDAETYLSISEYAGVLVGGASLDAKKFISIIKKV